MDGWKRLNVGELRTSGVSSEVEPGGDLRTLRIARVELRDLDIDTALGSLRAASAELANLQVQMATTAPPDAPLSERIAAASAGELRIKEARIVPRGLPPAGAGGGRTGPWRLEPLGALEGSLHADIVDAAWIFDADVTIPIGGGRIDFNRATVEHIGPDSTMGVSRMGVYVDAPNGRTYLFLFSATHVPGAQFERRDGSLLPGWRGDRGAIDLQPLLEGLLCGVQIGTLASGTRDMVARTRLSGEFRLGDGVMGDPHRRVVLTGRERGSNHVALSSLPSGQGVLLRLPGLSAAELRWQADGWTISTGALAGTVSVQLEDAAEPTLNIAELALQDVRAVGRRDGAPAVSG
jgi:hypothetical protein